MKVYQLIVSNFRGIKSFDWRIDSPLVCLIGAGNSTKTTILDAIYYALYPHWNLVVTDADFHQADTSNPISIKVTVGQLPKGLVDLYRYGDCYGGRSDSGDLVEEPSDNDEMTLTIELVIDDSLEPKWFLRSNRIHDERPISHKERSLLGVFRIGDFVDREFAWGRGSALSRLTMNEDEVPRVLSKASRLVRVNFEEADCPELNQVAQSIVPVAKRFGGSFGTFHPAVDSQISGTISLHDNKVPVRLSGLGSRRLLAIGMQSQLTPQGSIVLIDEIEQGLEPHRLRHLIKVISPDGQLGQTFITTHSPIVVASLEPNSIYLIRNNSSAIQAACCSAYPTLTKTIKEVPEALLAKRIIVCEGITERALCCELDGMWSTDKLESLTCLGVVALIPNTGGGRTKSPRAAYALAQIGYSVLYLGDSDEPLDPGEQDLAKQGVLVLLWGDGLCIETRAFRDLMWEGVVELISDYIELHTSYCEQGGFERKEALTKTLKHIGQHITSRNPSNETAKEMMREIEEAGAEYQKVINEWRSKFDETEIRSILGKAATTKEHGWFKSENNATRFAATIAKHLAATPDDTDLVVKINRLRQWIDG